MTAVLLSSTLHAFARALVEAGRYSSVSAVLQQAFAGDRAGGIPAGDVVQHAWPGGGRRVRAGVDLLRQRLNAEELETAALRELLSRRRKDERISAERMDTRLGGVIADKRRAPGLPS